MQATDENKRMILGTVMPPIMQAIAAVSRDGAASADDVIDFFALAIAAVVDNDTHLAGARDFRLAGQVVGAMVEKHAGRLRQMQGGTGISHLSRMLESAAVIPILN